MKFTAKGSLKLRSFLKKTLKIRFQEGMFDKFTSGGGLKNGIIL
jgi:hypothetical protein